MDGPSLANDGRASVEAIDLLETSAPETLRSRSEFWARPSPRIVLSSYTNLASSRLVFVQNTKQEQPALYVCGHQEILFDMFLPVLSQLLGKL